MTRRRSLGVLRTPLGATGASLLVALALLAIFAPMVGGDRAMAPNSADLLAGPSAQHWAGTDNLGRDILFRTLVATRLSIVLTLLATTLGIVLGILLGVTPMLVGARAGGFIVALINVLVAFPGLLMILFLAVILGVSTTSAVLAIGIAIAPGFGRLVHTLVSGVAERDYVAAARTLGVHPVRIILRHVLPNIAEPLVVQTTITAGGVIVAFAGLSFLGIGVQAPQYDWGRLMQDGLSNMYANPLAVLVPATALILAGLAFNLTGEAAAGTFSASARAGRGHSRLNAEPESRHARATGRVDEADVDSVLVVRDLSVAFPGANGHIRPVRGVSFTVRTGEAVGIVGESGSGKSLTALAIAKLVEEPGKVAAEQLTFCNTDLDSGRSATDDALLGTSLAVVFQDPMTSFNPVMRVGSQLAEVSHRHQGFSRKSAIARAVDRLRAVRIPNPEARARQYPHELSGGMRQRAMIGMGLMGNPQLIIADEPTTALDMIVQSQTLALLQGIRREHNTALLLISHDISVVADICDRVLVMYAGKIVEDLPVADLHTRARHPYTRALIAAVPDMSTDVDTPLATISGSPVNPTQIPDGCAYAARCPLASARCLQEEPVLEAAAAGSVACWHAGAAEIAEEAVR